MPTSTEVVGVDGCRAGWIAAFASGQQLRIEWFATFAEVLTAAASRPIGVDMPLPPFPASMAARDRRRSDVAAREFLGPARSSIFWTPSAELVERWRTDPAHPRGAGVSIQTWNLLPKIADVTDALAGAQGVALEVHPECSFRAMSPGTTFESKKTPSGRTQRLTALRERFDLPWPPSGPLARFTEDVLDAAAAAWTMQRYQQGGSFTLPAGAEPGEPTITV